jgi:serine/threonine protein kinase
MKKQILAQIRIMQSGNVGITHIYEVLESATDFHIVQENLEGGHLEDKRINVGGFFEEMRCSEIVEQILQVLSHLHENKIIHRNICPANIMFASLINNDF